MNSIALVEHEVVVQDALDALPPRSMDAAAVGAKVLASPGCLARNQRWT